MVGQFPSFSLWTVIVWGSFSIFLPLASCVSSFALASAYDPSVSVGMQSGGGNVWPITLATRMTQTGDGTTNIVYVNITVSIKSNPHHIHIIAISITYLIAD